MNYLTTITYNLEQLLTFFFFENNYDFVSKYPKKINNSY